MLWFWAHLVAHWQTGIFCTVSKPSGKGNAVFMVCFYKAGQEPQSVSATRMKQSGDDAWNKVNVPMNFLSAG